MKDKAHLLLLVHRIPFPPNKGDKIRSFNLLKHLAAQYQVHLGCYIDDQDDLQYIDKVKTYCGDTHFSLLRPLLAKIRSLKALVLNRPLSQDYFYTAKMQAWVNETIERRQIQHIVIFSSPMGQYVDHISNAKIIVDFVDVDSDKWLQYAQNKSWPMSWLYRLEGKRLLGFERKLAASSDNSLFVSEAEANLFKRLAPESSDKIGFLNNGVDTDYFSPEHSFPDPYEQQSHIVVFTGAMDYWPNCEAVTWFARDIFPLIRKHHPAALFYIVGSRPTESVVEVGKLEGVHVTGSVPDIRPYLHHADAVVAPLLTARGVQNKVLEAMAMARTVVVSAQALEGIDATPGTELLLAANLQAFVAHVCAIFDQKQNNLGLAARAKVMQSYNWHANLSAIDSMLTSTTSDIQ
ncbi:TIGR03087 family PEP-CTERM/XrtA system glycosyltransferase [Undibacterium sp. SXout20W]|uniref:TIGR03087 family PEP-CTERM/XrtA system glycosyltransferase n=1 Tax=Undibacterium sp. SXout20W TaxID=3413051 RepID=UPI003BF37869